jgi:tRNA (guanine-N7-)-methyltransferase
VGKNRFGEGPQSSGEVSESENKRFQFYGRRRGKTLRRRHLQLTEELLPAIRVDLNRPLEARAGDVWLEIGFGGGEHLAHQAATFPDVNFIGAEPFRNGVAKLLALIETKALTNIRVHDDDVRYLLEKLPPASLSKIFVLYPDPWPKKRHHERRIVNADTLKQFHALLKPDGLFLFASDIIDYVEWTLRACKQHGGFTLLSGSAEPYENWFQTRYEAKAKREGRETQYLIFRKMG